MQTLLVSIIIPTFNRAHLIGETLDSVLAQTYTNWECIVVDDGSTDSTDKLLAEYCEKDKRFQYHHRPKDRLPGGNAARNYGFEKSKGEYIQWFDDDDIMLKDFIEIKLIKFKTEINFVIYSGCFVDSNLQNEENIALNEDADLFKDYVLWNLPILTPSVLFRRTYLIDKKLFSPEIKRGQESELFSRLFFKIPNESFNIVNIPLFLYRRHSKTKSYHNKTYVAKFKESLSFIAVENFKKGIILNDFQIINFYNKILINLFFRGLENNHLKNINYIRKEMILLLKKINILRAYEALILFSLSLIIKRGGFRIAKILKRELL